MIYLGIDNGVSGSIGLINTEGSHYFHPQFIMKTLNYQKGRYYICMNNYQKAIESWQYLENSRSMNLLGYAYAKAGKVDEARQILEKVMKEKYKGNMSYELKIASLYTGLGEYDNAFGVLEKAYEEHVHDLPCITLWPFFYDLRSDPRYKALLKKMELPED